MKFFDWNEFTKHTSTGLHNKTNALLSASGYNLEKLRAIYTIYNLSARERNFFNTKHAGKYFTSWNNAFVCAERILTDRIIPESIANSNWIKQYNRNSTFNAWSKKLVRNATFGACGDVQYGSKS